MAKEYTLVNHTFRAGETIYGVIKYYNDNNMTADEFTVARVYYLIENSVRIRRTGENVKIPVLNKYKKST